MEKVFGGVAILRIEAVSADDSEVTASHNMRDTKLSVSFLKHVIIHVLNLSNYMITIDFCIKEFQG